MFTSIPQSLYVSEETMRMRLPFAVQIEPAHNAGAERVALRRHSRQVYARGGQVFVSQRVLNLRQVAFVFAHQPREGMAQLVDMDRA